jgi:hypothetical protein
VNRPLLGFDYGSDSDDSEEEELELDSGSTSTSAMSLIRPISDRMWIFV